MSTPTTRSPPPARPGAGTVDITVITPVGTPPPAPPTSTLTAEANGTRDGRAEVGEGRPAWAMRSCPARFRDAARNRRPRRGSWWEPAEVADIYPPGRVDVERAAESLPQEEPAPPGSLAPPVSVTTDSYSRCDTGLRALYVAADASPPPQVIWYGHDTEVLVHVPRRDGCCDGVGGGVIGEQSAGLIIRAEALNETRWPPSRKFSPDRVSLAPAPLSLMMPGPAGPARGVHTRRRRPRPAAEVARCRWCLR